MTGDAEVKLKITADTTELDKKIGESQKKAEGGTTPGGGSPNNLYSKEAAEAEAKAEQKAAEAAEKAVAKKQAAAKKSADAAAVEARYNELLALSKRELVAELQRIGRARQMAAAQGETQEVERLTKEYYMARRALFSLNQQKTLGKVASLQQVQAASALVGGVKSLTQSFANLGESAKNGTLDLSGMAQQVISLGFAFKAGLGPIGLVVAAIEVATQVWNEYAQRQKRVRETTLASFEAMKRLDEARLKAATANRERLLADRKAETDRAVEEAKRESDGIIAENNRMQEALRQKNAQAIEQRAAEQLAEEQELARKGTAFQLEELRRRHALEMQLAKKDAADAERALQQTTADEQEKFAEKKLKEQKRLSDGMRKGYQQILDIGFTEEDRETVEHYFRQVDKLTDQREVTNAAIDRSQKKIEAYVAKHENSLETAARGFSGLFGIGKDDGVGLRVEQQKEEEKRLRKELSVSLEQEAKLNKEIEKKYPQILAAVSKLEQAEGLSAVAKFKLYFQIKEQMKAADKETAAAEQAAADAASHAKNLRDAEKASKKLAETEKENARKAAETALANLKLDEAQKKILKATKTAGSYSERDTRTQYDILTSDRAILAERLKFLINAREEAKASGADAEKIRGLDADITALKKSLRGAGQQIDDAVPQLVKSLREGIKPGELVALNPDKQGQIDEVAAKMAQYGTELADLYRKRADAARRAAKGDEAAKYEQQQIDEQISKRYRKLAKDAEGIDERVVGGRAGTDLFKRIDEAARATADEYSNATKRLQAARTDDAKARQKAAEDGIAAQLERRHALLTQQNDAMEAALTAAQQQGGGTADALGRVLGASERMLQYLTGQQNALVAAQGRIARLEARLNALDPKIANLVR